ncbi:MAG TPA: RNA-binding cell elongation regulator Jag/EloR [Spirillospora sp.]|nr:RNA-binding cell elongation regulator Jag/EloR [Spirillospora sp.]
MDSGRSIEVTGEDVEQAIAKGLAELNAGPGDVIVEVLEEPARGMFGIGARPARVRLQMLVAPSPAAQEKPIARPVPTVEITDDDEDGDDSAFIGDTAEVYEGPLDEDAEVGKVVLTELLEKMSIRARVEVRRAQSSGDGENTPWLLDVSGSGDLSMLIGRRGETLASLQYVTRLITSRELQRRANIVVDVAGYKARRTSKLSELALRMADQAVRQKRTVTLEPMPPYERRIIHLALRNRDDVMTQSVGEGQARKVTIVPK